MFAVAITIRHGRHRGGYEPVADSLLGHEAVEAFFLEFDDDRSGDFQPLRFVPETKKVVLGLVTSKKWGSGRERKLDCPDQRSQPIRALRAFELESAVWLCFNRGGQHSVRRRSMEEIAADH